MNSGKLTPGYMLHVNGNPQCVEDSLEAAKAAAAPFVQKRHSLRIESYVAPVPSQVFEYDYEIEAWVEQN